MNRKSLWIILLTLGMTYVAGCGSSSNGNGIQVNIEQPPPPGFLAPDAAPVSVTATVTGDSKNAGVTWSCTSTIPANACGSFNPSTTPSGTATMYSAPDSVGGVTIIATSVTNTADFATANVQISTSGGVSGNYAFYVSGLDANGVYSLAGAVTIASDGTLTGEQDYNDANGVNVSDDTISSGILTFDPNAGLGILKLNTTSLGTEILALNFVNNNHALIIEADGFATSSGSMDLQTLPSTLAGGFSFTLSGARSDSSVIFINGGVFQLSGTSLTAGFIDTNDGGTIHTDQGFTGTLVAPDASGRGTGTFTGSPIVSSIVYYVVGPEAIRIIDMDKSDTAVGSAFGQGASAGNFTNASIGNSVFSIQSNFAGNLYASVGQVFPSGADAGRVKAAAAQPEGTPVTNDFNGVADVNEEQVGFVDAQIISGTYSLASNGYGSLTILPAGTLGDVSALGIYATDPNLNISDPNNPTGGGGALVADLDDNVAGSGVLVPQTDPSTGSFSGNYALGFQDFIDNGVQSGELDFVGNATATAVSPALLTGNGTVSDPFDLLGGASASLSGSFTSPITPDGGNLGRYEISPFSVTVDSVTTPIPYLAVVYQASGGQLFWLEDGNDGQASVFGGQLQQQVLPLGGEAQKAALQKKSQKH